MSPFLNLLCFLLSGSLFLIFPGVRVFTFFSLSSYFISVGKKTYKSLFWHPPSQFWGIEGRSQSKPRICYSCCVSLLTGIWCQCSSLTTSPQVWNSPVSVQDICLTFLLWWSPQFQPTAVLASFLFQQDGFSKSISHCILAVRANVMSLIHKPRLLSFLLLSSLNKLYLFTSIFWSCESV